MYVWLFLYLSFHASWAQFLHLLCRPLGPPVRHFLESTFKLFSPLLFPLFIIRATLYCLTYSLCIFTLVYLQPLVWGGQAGAWLGNPVDSNNYLSTPPPPPTPPRPHCKDTVPKIRNKYSQKWNSDASFSISTFMYLWAIYIFPGSVCLFCSKMYLRPIYVYIFPGLVCLFCRKMYLWAIYIFPGSVCLSCCRKIGELILGIYNTDTCMWKLGTRQRSFISGNTWIGYPLQCTLSCGFS